MINDVIKIINGARANRSGNAIGSSIGGIIGRMCGGGIFSSIGRVTGGVIGGLFDKKQDKRIHEYYVFGKSYDNLEFFAEPTGQVIPLVFGTAKVEGEVLWVSEVRCERYSYDNNSQHSVTHHTDYIYYIDLVIGVCEGEVDDIKRIWVNGKESSLNYVIPSRITAGNNVTKSLLKDEHDPTVKHVIRKYIGSKSQMPDEMLVRKYGHTAKAYRDLAYVVIENYNISNHGNTIPIFEFEVSRYEAANGQNNFQVESKICNIVISNTGGEYGFDSIIQHQNVMSPNGAHVLFLKSLNSSISTSDANAIVNFRELQGVCSLEWASINVHWFCDSTDLERCNLYPGIDKNEPNMRYTDPWKVASTTRNNGRIIKNKTFGCTSNDASLIRYIKTLQKNGIKIMFSPNIVFDIDKHYWIGELSSTNAKNTESIVNRFFRRNSTTNSYSYRDFILHYARLLNGLVDAFIIGSELVGITSLKTQNNTFCGVQELKLLANDVKAILGENVIVTYAAHWKEYHHTKDGWYNLDELWSSNSIDVIGINNYMPVTKSHSEYISSDDIYNSFKCGNGFDYEINTRGEIEALDARYAWKNLEWWWSNYHINPNKTMTSWVPQSKNVWFTEFGFVSMSKCTNTPRCYGDSVPEYSDGSIDLNLQRRAIAEFYRYWSTHNFIEKMFLNGWNAADLNQNKSISTMRSMYINGKFGLVSVSGIISSIVDRTNIYKLNVTTIDDSVKGIVFDRKITTLNAIDMLRCAYFFDIQDGVHFVKRHAKQIITINADDFVLLNNMYYEISYIGLEDSVQSVGINFTNEKYENMWICKRSAKYSVTTRNIAEMYLPIVYSQSEAENVANLIVNNIESEKRAIFFALPMFYANLKPSDYINIVNLEQDSITARIKHTIIQDEMIQIIAVAS